MNKITFVEFLDLIQPSFAAIDSKEDMDAILARTHVVLLGEHGVYWRVASIEKKEVNFEPWPKDENKDLLAEDQVPIFKAYKANPTNHQLPPNFHEDSVWSQEVLCRWVAAGSIPKIVTYVRHTGVRSHIKEALPMTAYPPSLGMYVVYLSCSAAACPCRVTRVVLSLSEISIRCLPHSMSG